MGLAPSCLYFTASPRANLRFVFLSNWDKTGGVSQTPRWLQSSLPICVLWYKVGHVWNRVKMFTTPVYIIYIAVLGENTL